MKEDIAPVIAVPARLVIEISLNTKSTVVLLETNAIFNAGSFVVSSLLTAVAPEAVMAMVGLLVS